MTVVRAPRGGPNRAPRVVAKRGTPTDHKPPDPNKTTAQILQDEADAAHVPNVTSRDEVSIARMAKMTDEELAASYGISVECLQKHYGTELVEGAAMKRRQLVVATYKRAMDGSPAAVKILDRMCDSNLVPGSRLPRDVVDRWQSQKPKTARQMFEERQAEKKAADAAAAAQLAADNAARAARGEPPMDKAVGAEKAPKLGKKERKNAEAKTARHGTSWDKVLPGANAQQLQ